jgi:hypothetical protein
VAEKSFQLKDARTIVQRRRCGRAVDEAETLRMKDFGPLNSHGSSHNLSRGLSHSLSHSWSFILMIVALLAG